MTIFDHFIEFLIKIQWTFLGMYECADVFATHHFL